MTILKATDLPLYYNAADILDHNLPDRANKVSESAAYQRYPGVSCPVRL